VPRRSAIVRHWGVRRADGGRQASPQEVDVHRALLAAGEAAATGVPPAVVGLVGFGVLVALLAVTYTFRNSGHRNSGQHD
jgi:hypothetical protein